MSTMQRTLLLALLLAFSTASNATIVWGWSFGSNAGQFTTTGTAIGNVASPGTYSITDFSVTASGTGATLGSLSGGQYADSGFATVSPYKFVWNGSAVTSWLQSGTNLFNWLVFDDLSTPNYFFFGWETGNINTAMQAVYYPASQTSSLLSIGVVSAVDEPGTMGLFALGIAAVALARRRAAAHAKDEHRSSNVTMPV